MRKRLFPTILLCVPDVDLAAVFLARMADFSRRTLFGHKYAYGGRMKAQTQWTIICFLYWNYYNTLILQLCTEHFSTTILDVLGI